MYRKYKKGDYKYADYKKAMDAIYMALMVLMSIGLFLIGYFTTGTERNLLTIVAVLGLLPACKMVVSLIMSLRVKSCDETVKDSIESHLSSEKGYIPLFHLYFTSYDKNYYLKHAIITDNSLIGYSDSKDFNENDFGQHMSTMMRKEGLKDITVKVFTDLNKYLKRLDEIGKSERDIEYDQALYNLVMNITL